MATKKLKVFLFNVGAGDHIMLEFPDKSIGIIDSFFSSNTLKLKEPPVVTYLKSRVEEAKNTNEKIRIAFLCISHADHDHIKGIKEIIRLIDDDTNNIKLENLFLFAGVDFETYKKDIEKINRELIYAMNDKKSIEEYEVKAKKYNENLLFIQMFKEKWNKKSSRSESYFEDFREFNLYDQSIKNFKAFSIGPLANLIKAQNDISITDWISMIYERNQKFINKMEIKSPLKYKLNRNPMSGILGIHFSPFNLLFLGDSTKEVIEASLFDIYNRSEELHKFIFNPCFVKVGHHGSGSSTSESIWNKLFTKKNIKTIFGISAGENKKYKHPESKFFNDVTTSCLQKNIEHNIFRTNVCKECNIVSKIDKTVDLDKSWFKFDKTTVNDPKLNFAIKKDSPNPKKNQQESTIYSVIKNDAPNFPIEKNPSKNLLAYIFEFSDNSDITIYEGVSSIIGKYGKCIYPEKNQHYCN